MTSRKNPAAAAKPARSKQQQRTQATRTRIIEAATAEYGAHGIDGTRIADVIAAARVGTTTFYRYFNGPDELLNAVLLHEYQALMAKFDTARIRHDDPLQQIVEDLVYLYATGSHSPTLRLVFGGHAPAVMEKLGPALAAIYADANRRSLEGLEALRAQGLLRAGMDVNRIVEWCGFIVFSLHGAVVPFPFLQDPIRLREFLRDFLLPALIDKDHPLAASERGVLPFAAG